MVEPARDPAVREALARAERTEEEILRYRRFRGPVGWLFTAVAAALIGFTIYQVGWGRFGYAQLLPVFLGLSFVTVFALFPASKRLEFADPAGLTPAKRWLRRALRAADPVLAALGVLSTFYLWSEAEGLVLRAGRLSQEDVWIATIGLFVLAEATRRTVGLPMTILAGAFGAYAYFGHLLDPRGLLFILPKPWPLLTEQLWYGNEGVFGIPVQVAAKYVLAFVALGALFRVTGVGEFFITLAYSVTGHRRGGPAKTAVLASALMGTVNGSSIANAVATGSFTIPMMRKVGYRREFAAAVEASASTGGQIMPPIMGAAAFVMVEILGIPYRTIVLAAVIPALCFFFGAWVMVHLEARRRNLASVPKSELPSARKLLRANWYMLLPFAVLLGLLFDPRVDVLRAAVYTAAATALISFARKETRLTIPRIRDAIDETARNMAGVTMAVAAAGVIAGVVTLTGLGSRIVLLVSDLSGGVFLVALALTMLACLLLGMGLPTTATYILVVTVAAPVIIHFPGHPMPAGLTLLEWALVAHMFVFFYGVVADVTPPVALAAYAASGIAGSNQFQTGLEAFKISLNKFIVPFAFVYQPAILLLGIRWDDPLFLADFALDVVTLFAGILFLHAGLSRYLFGHATRWESWPMVIGGILMMFPLLAPTLAGFALAGAGAFSNRRRARAAAAGA